MKLPKGGAVWALAISLLATGCEDLRHFTGRWAGTISPDPRQRKGFDEGALLGATVEAAVRARLDLLLDLPGRAAPQRFEPVQGAAGDALGELRLEGDPLRSYVGFVRPPGEEPYFAVVSLFPEERIDVRLIRGPDEAYGVFSLRRVFSTDAATAPPGRPSATASTASSPGSDRR